MTYKISYAHLHRPAPRNKCPFTPRESVQDTVHSYRQFRNHDIPAPTPEAIHPSHSGGRPSLRVAVDASWTRGSSAIRRASRRDGRRVRWSTCCSNGRAWEDCGCFVPRSARRGKRPVTMVQPPHVPIGLASSTSTFPRDSCGRFAFRQRMRCGRQTFFGPTRVRQQQAHGPP